MTSRPKITQTRALVLEECFTCGIGIAMTEDQLRAFNEKGMTITCVLGHQTVRCESDVQKLKKQLTRAQDRVATLETEAVNQCNLLQAETVKRKKLETRVNNGVCPHCRRSFQNLKRHIASQHAESAEIKGKAL